MFPFIPLQKKLSDMATLSKMTATMEMFPFIPLQKKLSDFNILRSKEDVVECFHSFRFKRSCQSWITPKVYLGVVVSIHSASKEAVSRKALMKFPMMEFPFIPLQKKLSGFGQFFHHSCTSNVSIHSASKEAVSVLIGLVFLKKLV